EDDGVGGGDHPPVEPQHEPGHERARERERDQHAVERDARHRQRRQLHRLAQPRRHVDGREEHGERARQLDDLGDVVPVVRPEHLPHRRPPIHEVVDVLDVVEHDEEDDEQPEQQRRRREEAPEDVEVEAGHGIGEPISRHAKHGRGYARRGPGTGGRGSCPCSALARSPDLSILRSPMKLHEYQANDLLAQYGVAVQRGVVAETVEEAVAAAEQMAAEGVSLFVVKAQIHAGGRGKGGGVKLARSVDEVREKAGAILGMQLVTPQTGPEGQTVRKVLVTAAEDIAHEYYVGVTLDRARGQNVIMASTEGGVEIEEVAEKTPEKIVKVYVDPAVGLRPFQAVEIASRLGFEGPAFK